MTKVRILSPNDADNVGNAKWLYPPLNGGVNSLAFRGPLPSRRFVVTYGRLSIFPPNDSRSFQSSFSSLFTNMISYPFPSFHLASAQISCNGPRYQVAIYGTADVWSLPLCLFRSRSLLLPLSTFSEDVTKPKRPAHIEDSSRQGSVC